MPLAAYHDVDAFEAIASALTASGAFAAVILAAPAELDTIGADRVPAAVIMPQGWTEVRDTDSGSVRHVGYTLTLLIKGGDGADRFRRLDQLAAVAQGTLNGADHGGTCLPAFSRLDQGRFDLALKRLEGRAVLTGAFAYLVAGNGN